MKNTLQVRATLVDNEFVDRYMPDANGEYVKVYLYLLRHSDRDVSVLEVADALNYTESDIRRALAYWERLGVLAESREKETAAAGETAVSGAGAGGGRAVSRAAAGGGRTAFGAASSRTGAAAVMDSGRGKAASAADGVSERAVFTADDSRRQAAFAADGVSELAAFAADGSRGQAAFAADGVSERTVSVTDGVREGAVSGANAAGERTSFAAEADRQSAVSALAVGNEGSASAERSVSGLPDARIPAPRESYTPEQVKKLSEDEEFTQLLYVAQKYLNKVFTPRDCEVFAYLYDGLRLPAELLEYLVEYCVQGGHDSIRYLETVGLNWHEKGINTVERAKQYTASYSNEAFAVMRAFGLSDRRPGSSEMEMIQRWFREWGFTKEMILEACARTLAATNKPSFAYADRILMEWKKADAHTMEDVRKLDEAREKARSAEAAAKGAQAEQQASAVSAGRTGGQTAREGVSGSSRGASRAVSGGARNRFHNFEQRDTDYDAIVLRQLKERLGKQ